MMPRIEAQETLTAYNRSALCHNVGFEDEADRQRVIAQIERKASGERAPAPARADPQDLAGMGIGITRDGGETPVIDDLAAWLGQEPDASSSSAAIGHQDG